MIKNLVGQNQKYCLYGARKFGKIALKKLNQMGVQVYKFIDDNQIIQNTYINGIEVVSLKAAIELYGSELKIIITNYYLESCLKKLEKFNMPLQQVVYINDLLIEDLDFKLIKANKNRIVKTYDMLADYKSKFLYKSLFESRNTKDLSSLVLLKSNLQYFQNDILSFNDDEVFIDAGAFTGDTILEFISQVHNYKKIYAFEPDSQNYNILKNKKIENASIYNAGLYNKNCQLSFENGQGGSSAVSLLGTETIQVYSFDKLDIEYEPTFVKMDIEGCELKALEGMQDMIRKNAPKLAICIYHKLRDLWEIPEYIKELVPNYNIYIRNYTNWLDEVVLYATL